MRIMGLSLLNPEFPSPAGRFLLFTTKVMNRTFPSKIYLIFFLDTANLELYPYNPCSFYLPVFFEHGFIGLTRMLGRGEVLSSRQLSLYAV